MFHSVEQRCVRWLLTVSDLIDTGEIPLTHDLLATMLGVHRPTVTLVLRSLHKAGLVNEAAGSSRCAIVGVSSRRAVSATLSCDSSNGGWLATDNCAESRSRDDLTQRRRDHPVRSGERRQPFEVRQGNQNAHVGVCLSPRARRRYFGGEGAEENSRDMGIFARSLTRTVTRAGFNGLLRDGPIHSCVPAVEAVRLQLARRCGT